MRVGNIVNMGYGMYYKIIREETLADGRKVFDCSCIQKSLWHQIKYYVYRKVYFWRIW